jgi:hypothetical protein
VRARGLDLGVKAFRLGTTGEQLLERLPVRGVVHVLSDVGVGGAEEPRRARLVTARVRVTKARLHLPTLGRLRIQTVERLRQRRREARQRVQVHPDACYVDLARVTLEGDAALGPQTPVAAAEREAVHTLAEAGKALGANAHPPDYPDRLGEHTRIVNVRIRDVLNPARNRIHAHTATGRGIRKADPKRLLVDAPYVRNRNDLAELHPKALT